MLSVCPQATGNLLAHMLLPKAYEYVLRLREASVVIIGVEPLAALAADQVERAKAMNLLPAILSCQRSTLAIE